MKKDAVPGMTTDVRVTPDRGRAATRSPAPSCAGSATPRCGRRWWSRTRPRSTAGPQRQKSGRTAAGRRALEQEPAAARRERRSAEAPRLRWPAWRWPPQQRALRRADAAGLDPGGLDDGRRRRVRVRARRRPARAPGRRPSSRATPIVTVILIAAPLAFLVGIGGFDYWGRWMIGAPTEPEDHSDHGARSWKDYFRVNTDHKVIGIQYTVTALFFLLVGGALAEVIRAELAQPGQQVVDSNTYNGLFSVHAVADDLPGHHPDLRGARELRDPADDRRAGHGVPAPERAQLLAAAGGRDHDGRRASWCRTAAPSTRAGRPMRRYRPTRRWASSSSRSACSSRAPRRS